jgi:carbamoyl-phosphate synthase large subunit
MRSDERAPGPEGLPLVTAATPQRRKARPAGVMLTGVGGIIGQGIIKCLARAPYRIVGLDASELAAGIYAVPKAYLVPIAQDPGYIDRLLEICEAEEIRYLFPGLDMELPLIAREADRFRDAGVTPVLSRLEVIELGDDKLDTVRFLEAHGFPAPRTFDVREGREKELGCPLVLKPRKGGSRSQGVHFVQTERDLDLILGQIDRTNYVAQEYVEGDEYSCGTINFDGKCLGVLVMRRTLRDGDTHKAYVVRDEAIEAYVKKVAEALKPFGPCNFQLRVRDGIPMIFEINPRCSGSSYMRALAGFNEPLMTLNWLEHGIPPSFQIRLVSVFRYWKEIIVDSRKVAEVKRAGSARNNPPAL